MVTFSFHINRNSLGLVGDIGVVIYSIFFLFCFWRLYVVHEQKDYKSIYRNMFNVTVALAAFFDLIYYVSMADVNK
jgi:hypothetical protein